MVLLHPRGDGSRGTAVRAFEEKKTVKVDKLGHIKKHLGEE